MRLFPRHHCSSSNMLLCRHRANLSTQRHCHSRSTMVLFLLHGHHLDPLSTGSRPSSTSAFTEVCLRLFFALVIRPRLSTTSVFYHQSRCNEHLSMLFVHGPFTNSRHTDPSAVVLIYPPMHFTRGGNMCNRLHPPPQSMAFSVTLSRTNSLPWNYLLFFRVAT